MGKKLTIKAIAEMAGVSSATVSKVLNNTGRYSEETKQNILDIVKKYDYRPNAVAKSLRTSKSKTIGVIVPDITNEFFAQIVLAIENHCGELGYSVFICNSNENEEKELKYFEELELKGVDGLIYLSASDQLFQMKTQLPIVCIDRKPKLHNVAIVTSDNFNGGSIAARELLQKGCKNLLIISDYRDVFPTMERLRGFQKVMEDNQIPFSHVKVEVGIKQAQKAIDFLIKDQGFQYDGIFATTDWLAFGVKLALEHHQINVPEKVKIIGYDNISLAEYMSISSIDQNKVALGTLAAKKLLNMIDNGVSVDKETTIPVKYIERNSTLNF
ncbi:hypothetical protein AJ85_06445 [Alkalihalobacillus alcalophilus ATCC 27647 = CGMCC 1.3604]|uniref:HTH lacI-type domain-containing protein n=1 Tax=Alkalihalobacillus alcalophilus ATCC 27647 = CGMCC 1.3604 TaxID=1218173 RepID=A0A094WRH4_ALKAL|nr:LacI family DNA-binding transcriptional regulator [Alkalihalobacillus alcalophilus]KGA98653.1 hypothetical protein BALCAV_0203265 [Alkalihalobacillus alcalophilus ATCC 27647 = CGMCC 1.3604]MED1562430.1 LacI family DNA-binding transcriptional regulator [Alkalihalobacillus alcalophilus]THG91166.1 hypothetical protein AJ85_06445 [Alkalihalobacillus alcalophilus ATCC 27647 = CGMCC 1.3604]